MSTPITISARVRSRLLALGYARGVTGAAEADGRNPSTVRVALSCPDRHGPALEDARDWLAGLTGIPRADFGDGAA